MEAPAVFISYSDADRSLAELLHDDLRRAGARVFQFSQTATIGTPSWTEILEKISAADVFVLLVTEAANASAPVQAELEHAYGSRINIKRPSKIIPAIVDKGVHPPTLAVGFNWLPFDEYEIGLTRLLGELSLSRVPEQEQRGVERETARTAYEHGVANIRSRDFGAAVNDFTQALVLAPGFIAALNNLGAALSQLERDDDAIDAYEVSVNSDPTNALGYINLGLALTRVGKYEEAEEAIERALDLAPTDGRAHAALGKWLVATGDTDGAAEAVERARTLAPGDRVTLQIYASVMSDTGHPEKGLPVLEELIAADQGDPDSLAERGRVFTAMGRYEKSLDSFDAALSILRLTRWVYNRGVALSLLGRFEEALVAIEEAFAAGFSEFQYPDEHEYLATLRDHPVHGPALQELLARYKPADS